MSDKIPIIDIAEGLPAVSPAAIPPRDIMPEVTGIIGKALQNLKDDQTGAAFLLTEYLPNGESRAHIAFVQKWEGGRVDFAITGWAGYEWSPTGSGATFGVAAQMAWGGAPKRALHGLTMPCRPLNVLERSGYIKYFLDKPKILSPLKLEGYVDLKIIDALKADEHFVYGPWHYLHRNVGTDRIDFRAYAGELVPKEVEPWSLQLVIDKKTGNCDGDVDKHNPYADVVSIFGHLGAIVFRRRAVDLARPG